MDHKKEIIKLLEKCGDNGYRQSTVFDDWLNLCCTTLEVLPEIVKSMTTETPYTDVPEVKATFEQLHDKYKKEECWDYFANAFSILLDSANEFQDVIGQVYMEYAYPNPGTGQFFTPWNIADMMAEMTMYDIDKQLDDAIKDGIRKNPAATAMLLASVAIHDIYELRKFYLTAIIPTAMSTIEPLKVLDPCVGSGVMLLAAAKHCPKYAVQSGLIQFWGVDIDPTCCKMAKVNCMLYGLNGYHLKLALELSAQELQALPQPQAEAYYEAQLASIAGDENKVVRITADLRANQYNFFNISQPQEK